MRLRKIPGPPTKCLYGRRFGRLTVKEVCPRIPGERTKWFCVCDCGNVLEVTDNNLISGGTTGCGCTRSGPREDLIGQTFGKLEVLDLVKKDGDFAWRCRCCCGKFTILSTHSLKSDRTESCGCLQSEWVHTNLWKGYEEISGAYFGQLKGGAESRNLQFNIRLEDIWELYVSQGKCCALTGLPIFFGKKSKRLGIREQTASLDRIDSTNGYVIENVQWVHKYIQLMKNKFTQDEFIRYCKLVAEHNR